MLYMVETEFIANAAVAVCVTSGENRAVSPIYALYSLDIGSHMEIILEATNYKF